jgi:hypothetical protein
VLPKWAIKVSISKNYRVPHNYSNAEFEFQPTTAVEKFNYYDETSEKRGSLDNSWGY